MTSDARTDYFEYLENVLGIKTILQSRAGETVAPSPIQTELLFCVQNYKTYSSDELDLLHKMIAAVKVDASRLQVCDLEDAKKYLTKYLVIFQDQTQSVPIPAEVTIQTFSPRVLTKKPELKKIAWTELQKILPFFA